MQHDTKHLAAAIRHVIEGEQRVTQQLRCIEKLATAGLDTVQAEKFLEILQGSLALMYRHLRMERTDTPE